MHCGTAECHEVAALAGTLADSLLLRLVPAVITYALPIFTSPAGLSMLSSSTQRPAPTALLVGDGAYEVLRQKQNMQLQGSRFARRVKPFSYKLVFGMVSGGEYGR